MQLTQDNLTRDQFIKLANQSRLDNKHEWVFINSILDDGREIQYKAYNCYIQILKIDGVNYTQGMSDKVSDFKATLAQL